MDPEGLTGLSSHTHNGREFLFCDADCRDRFSKDPEKFLGEPLIRVEDLWKKFSLGGASVEVLRGLSANIWEGDFVAILGPSGSGKSTLLNMMGLLDRPTAGKVFLRGEDISVLPDERRAELHSRMFGFVFQQFHLIPWLTAYENAALPLLFAGKSADSDALRQLFRDFGLSERMSHRPYELSGGEQQRVALLRALANDPAIVLGDEPTGNLDSVTGNRLLEVLIDLNKAKKKTLVIVTHDADIAGRADQIIVVRDGNVVRDHHRHKGIYAE